jgi:hypothetical protein
MLFYALSFFPLFEWTENHGVGLAIRSSTYWFPVVEAFHLLALAVIGGAVLIVDLRLFGLLLKREPVAQVARDAQPWLIGSLIVMLVSGFLLFSSEAVKCYYNGAFWFKMISLALAIVFTFTVHKKVVSARDESISLGWGRLIAIISLLLWSGVGVGGRAIGFY